MRDRPDARVESHCVVLYESDDLLLEQLVRFFGAGDAGDAMLVIATPEHRAALEGALRARLRPERCARRGPLRRARRTRDARATDGRLPRRRGALPRDRRRSGARSRG
jgi:hypothetical protein